MYEDQKSIAECINSMPDDWNQRCAYQNGVTLYSETPSDRIFEAIEALDKLDEGAWMSLGMAHVLQHLWKAFKVACKREGRIAV
jgi:hypothetical protein